MSSKTKTKVETTGTPEDEVPENETGEEAPSATSTEEDDTEDYARTFFVQASDYDKANVDKLHENNKVGVAQEITNRGLRVVGDIEAEPVTKKGKTYVLTYSAKVARRVEALAPDTITGAGEDDGSTED